MAHVHDAWRRTDGTRSTRYGRGRRWQVRGIDPTTGRAFSESYHDRAAALERAAELTREAERDGTRTGTLTLADYWARYAARATWRPRTRVQQLSRWRNWIAPAIGHARVDRVTVAHAHELADGVAGLAPATRRAVLGLAAQVLTAAGVDGLTGGREVGAVTALRARITTSPAGPGDVLTTAQVARLVEVLPTQAHKDLAALLAGTGLRVGEARALTLTATGPAWVRVARQLEGSATGPQAALLFGPPKGGRAGVRRLTTPRSVVPVLGRLRAQAAAGPECVVRDLTGELVRVRFLFSSPLYPGRPVGGRALSEVWTVAAGRAGLPSWARGWHALRHHHLSGLLAAGVSPVEVARRAGHSSPAITLSTYAHAWEGGDEGAAEAWDTVTGGPTGG